MTISWFPSSSYRSGAMKQSINSRVPEVVGRGGFVYFLRLSGI